MTDLSGKFRTTHKTLASGRTKIYYFTKPGGTRFFDCMDAPLSQPFPEAFVRAWQAAVDTESTTKVEGECAQIILDYMGGRKFQSLKPATREGYERDLAVARQQFGKASIKVMEDRRFKGSIIAWHETIAQRSPRRADLCLTVFREALQDAFKRGQLMHNPADGIETVWKPKKDKRPWSEQDIAKFLQDCPEATANAMLLGLYTGMRRTDLATVTWAAWEGAHLRLQTSKSTKTDGRAKTIIVPLTEEGQALLRSLKQAQMASPLGLQTTILVGENGRSMTPATVGKKVNNRTKALGITGTLHRLRNSYATLLVKADFDDQSIAGILGWNIEDVEELKRVYVHTDVIVAAQISRLNAARLKPKD